LRFKRNSWCSKRSLTRRIETRSKNNKLNVSSSLFKNKTRGIKLRMSNSKEWLRGSLKTFWVITVRASCMRSIRTRIQSSIMSMRSISTSEMAVSFTFKRLKSKENQSLKFWRGFEQSWSVWRSRAWWSRKTSPRRLTKFTTSNLPQGSARTPSSPLPLWETLSWSLP
jgi:hypothetical protein